MAQPYDYNVQVPDISGHLSTIVDALGKRNERKRLSEIGGMIQAGNLSGAAGAAFGQGQLDAGIKLTGMNDERRSKVGKIVANAVRTADTPEKWAQLTPILKKRFPGADLSPYEDFASRDLILAEFPGEAEEFASAGNNIFSKKTGKIVSTGGADGESGPYAGTGMDQQDMNILLTADPGTPTYAAAYARQYETPKLVSGQDAEGRMIVTPIMPKVPAGIRPPGASGNVEMIEGDIPPPGASPAPATAAAPPAPIVVGQKPEPDTVKAERAKIDSAYKAIDGELTRFVDLVKDSGVQAMVGTKKDNLNTVRQGIMLQLKELFNLGVLNGPDLSLMEKMIYDPVVDLMKEGGLSNVPGQIRDALTGSAPKRAKNSVTELRRMLEGMVKAKQKDQSRVGGGEGWADVGDGVKIRKR
jgi:hypothetical protein